MCLASPRSQGCVAAEAQLPHIDPSTVQAAARQLLVAAGYAETHREHRGGLEMIFMEKKVVGAQAVRL